MSHMTVTWNLREQWQKPSTMFPFSLTPQIVSGEDNKVFHVEWDNLNKTATNVHGSIMVNSTAVIMNQEVKQDSDIGD